MPQQTPRALSVLPCSVCGGTSVARCVERGDGKHVLFCSTCGMGRLHEVTADPQAFYDDDYYSRGADPGHGYADYKFTAEHGLLWTKLVVETLIPDRSAQVLDIGCADGYLLRRLEGDYRKFGIEMNPAAATRAATSGVTIIGSDILDPNLVTRHAATFDVITAIATFEHVPDIREAFHASLAMLAPRGVLIFEIPLISEPRDNTDWYTSSYEHFFYPTIGSLEFLFSCFPGCHFVGFETGIVGFGSTYIGLGTRDLDLLRECQRVIAVMRQADPRGLSDPDTRLNLAYTVIHAFDPTPERILRLPLLLEKQFNSALVTRLMQLWHGDAVKAAGATWYEQQASNWREAYESLKSSVSPLTEEVDSSGTDAGGDAIAGPELVPVGDRQAELPTAHTASLPSATPKATIVALLPFLVQGSLALAIMRALRARGADVAIAFCSQESGGYTADPMEDFAADGRLIDLSSMNPRYHQERLQREFTARGTRLTLQIGAYMVYPVLPYLKELIQTIKMVDILYNEVGHTLNHFLYENCFDGVIVESMHMRRFVERCTLKQDRDIRVVESGVDLDYFTPVPRMSAPGRLQVGYIGRMSVEKNPIGFIDLAERLAARVPGLQFSMVGEGTLSDDVRRRIATSPIQDRLIYHGRAPDVRDSLRALDVLIVPSRLDGRPNIIMEANACGVPVIGSPVGGIPELIEPGQNGVLASPGEVDSIAETLRAWMNDSATLTAIRRTCRSVAEARFDRSRMLDDYAAAFEDFVR